VPDDQDYEELAHLLASPDSWDWREAELARSLLRNQNKAVAGLTPQNGRLRESMQVVADQLEEAIRRWEEAR
jgi:hypothetical protein